MNCYCCRSCSEHSRLGNWFDASAERLGALTTYSLAGAQGEKTFHAEKNKEIA